MPLLRLRGVLLVDYAGGGKGFFTANPLLIGDNNLLSLFYYLPSFVIGITTTSWDCSLTDKRSEEHPIVLKAASLKAYL
jgi:hypothetical protein